MGHLELALLAVKEVLGRLLRKWTKFAGNPLSFTNLSEVEL